jgi:hypothetical protein
MKIIREESPVQPKPVRSWMLAREKKLRAFWHSWAFQVLLVVVAFAAGMWVFRAGYYRPIYTVLLQLMRGERISLQATLPAPLEQVASNLGYEARMYQDNGLPTLYLDIPFKSLDAMRVKREEALKVGVLLSSDDDLVPAKAHIGQEGSLDIEMRLKGDWTDHIKGDKWSFRIHTKNNDLILGMRQFSIQAPETRPYLLEWYMHQNLKDEGILTPRYEFINVLVNGEFKGIYALEENFTKELIESQARRAGLIIRFDEEPLWQNRAATRRLGLESDGIFSVADMESTDITPFGGGSIGTSPELAQEATAAMGKLRAFQSGKLEASQVFDVELMGRFYALSDLWSACHGTYWHNLRFYYNPITALLEPTVFDLEPLNCGAGDPTVYTNFESIIQEFIKIDNHIFGDPLIREAYARNLNRIANAGYLQNVIDLHDPQYQLFKKAMLVEYPETKLAIPVDQLLKRTQRLMVQLEPGQPVRGGFTIGGSAQQPVLKVELVNLMLLPVEVVRFEVLKIAIQAQASMVEAASPKTDSNLPTLAPVNIPGEGEFAPTQFTIPLDPLQFAGADTLQTIQVVVRLAGLTQEFKLPLLIHSLPQALIDGPKPPSPTIKELLQKHTFLTQVENSNRIEARPGVWDVQGDLVLPPGIEVVFPAGVTLRFGPEDVFLSYSPLTFLGNEDQAVTLTARGDSWPGLAVLDAGAPSIWNYVRVEKTRSISRNGWILTGGITFYKSPITLDHVSLLNTLAEDDINAVESPFVFRDSEFGQTASDAFDSDYSDGEISGCSFHNVGGDAVDTSGAVVSISDTRMLDITDKGVSAGESSRINITNVQMQNVGIGIASKDLSVVVANQVTIRGAVHAGLAAYTKKAVFGPGTIRADQTEVLDSQTISMVQTGSTLVLNGKTIQGRELDVKKLYELGILGN